MRIGFIGAGNMTSAITKGAVDLGILSSKDIYIYDRNDYKTRELCEKYGFNICRSQGEAEIKTDILVVAVKPANAKDVFSGISKAKAVISIVAGYSYADIKGCVLKKDIRFLRIMPNTPLAVGEGLSAFALPTDFTEEELKDCIAKAYDEKFDTEEIAPLAKADGMYFLELFHGKTIAFKDMALSILPYLMTTAAKKNHAKNEIVILTATSGDTG